MEGLDEGSMESVKDMKRLLQKRLIEDAEDPMSLPDFKTERKRFYPWAQFLCHNWMSIRRVNSARDETKAKLEQFYRENPEIGRDIIRN